MIAGDVFDGEWKDASIALFFNRQLARLSNRGVPIFLLRGNHDAESLVAKSLTWSENVFEFSTQAPADASASRICGSRCTDAAFRTARWWRTMQSTIQNPLAGWFNIGVLHTACGRAGHENYAPCTVADLAARGYDYWALGHVHAFEIVSRDPWIVYPGNLQGRSIRECGERGAVIVEVADGVVAEVRRVVTDYARWAEVVVDATPHSDETSLLRAVEAEVRPHAEAAAGPAPRGAGRLDGGDGAACAARRRSGAPARRGRGGGAALRRRYLARTSAHGHGGAAHGRRATPRWPKSIWPRRSKNARRTPQCARGWPNSSGRSRTSCPAAWRRTRTRRWALTSILTEARALALGRAGEA